MISRQHIPTVTPFGLLKIRRLRGSLPTLPAKPIAGRKGHGLPRVPPGQGAPLRGLEVGDHVRVQDFSSKRWHIKGRVVKDHGDRLYDIETTGGKILWRNRRFLLPVPAWDTADIPDMPEGVPGAPVSIPAPLRRSNRQAGVLGPENVYPVRRF
eukprot:snap_masked-scaffold47_size466558-processed-gene-0.1 protein:Tk04174 transcript:snap_masked-scaffold47_size466558-processed-gene-0.1-mRNA-1 annotation:"hypothetical protein DAPPUDRAFT_116586"